MTHVCRYCPWTPSHLFLGDRTGFCTGILDLYDEAKKCEMDTVGGLRLDKFLLVVADTVKWLERMGAHYPYVKCWGLLFRGCLERRLGRFQKALKLLVEGVQAATASNSTACICYLWLELGVCEERLAMAAKAGHATGSKTSQKRPSLRSTAGSVARDAGGEGGGAVVRPETGAVLGGAGAGDFIRAFNHAADMAQEAGMERIVVKAAEKLRAHGITWQGVGGVGGLDVGGEGGGVGSLGVTSQGSRSVATRASEFGTTTAFGTTSAFGTSAASRPGSQIGTQGSGFSRGGSGTRKQTLRKNGGGEGGGGVTQTNLLKALDKADPHNTSRRGSLRSKRGTGGSTNGGGLGATGLGLGGTGLGLGGTGLFAAAAAEAREGTGARKGSIGRLGSGLTLAEG